MTDSLDCRWIEKNLEALSCGQLELEQDRLAHAHIANCAVCRQEVEALTAVDPLVRKHFQRQLRIAQQPRAAHAGRALGLSAAAMALVAVLLFAGLRSPRPGAVVAPVQSSATLAVPVAEIPAPPSVKIPDPNASVERAKPLNPPANASDQVFHVQPPKSGNAPDFLVMDAAGFSRRVEDFRGHFILITVWSSASPEAISNFDRLYKAYGSQAKFRFAGVSNDRLSKPANTTFPVFYNQGSKLFGLQPGEFILLDEKGGIAMRGSLTKDFDTLQKALQQK
jgi:hypothetical protein